MTFRQLEELEEAPGLLLCFSLGLWPLPVMQLRQVRELHCVPGETLAVGFVLHERSSEDVSQGRGTAAAPHVRKWLGCL